MNTGKPLHSVLLAELVDPTARIDDLLLTCIKGVARRAHFDHEIFAERGTRRELVAATAGDLDICVVGMNVGFHF